MTFRLRLTLAMLAIAAVPLLILGYGIRREMTTQLDADATRRVTAAGLASHDRLAAMLETEHRRLESLASDLAADNRFRIALADSNSAERRWLLDWAPTAMRLTGFAVLQVQDSSGRILSSGQFRNDYDRVAPTVPRAAVLDARTASAPVRALVTTVAFTVRGQSYAVTGGANFDSARVAVLSGEPTVAALLVTDSAPLPKGAIATATLPYVNEASTGQPEQARIVLVPDNGPTRALEAGVTRWLLITLGLTLLAAVTIAALLGRLISIADRRTLRAHGATRSRPPRRALRLRPQRRTRRARTHARRVGDAAFARAWRDCARPSAPPSPAISRGK